MRTSRHLKYTLHWVLCNKTAFSHKIKTGNTSSKLKKYKTLYKSMLIYLLMFFIKYLLWSWSLLTDSYFLFKKSPKKSPSDFIKTRFSNKHNQGGHYFSNTKLHFYSRFFSKFLLFFQVCNFLLVFLVAFSTATGDW